MWKFYRKTAIQEMRPYILGEDLSGVSVNKEDTPELGGMIARNDDNNDNRWYVAKDFFEKNYEENLDNGVALTTPDSLKILKKSAGKQRRRIFRTAAHGWMEIPFSELKQGNIFRIIDDPPVVPLIDLIIYTASSDSYNNEDGFLEIEADIFTITIEEDLK